MRTVTLADSARLLTLAAIWGFSFLFMRMIAPVLGVFLAADLRLIIAGATLTLWFLATRHSLEWKRHGKSYFIIGALNCSMPFAFFCFAAMHIPASYSAIFNATSPIFGALVSVLWLGTVFTPQLGVGLVLGLGGVALVAKVGPAEQGPHFWHAVLSCTAASLCYGIGATYTKKHAGHIPAKSIAAGSQVAAGILLLPFAAAGGGPLAPVTLPIALATLAIGLFCSALAYLLYYRLIADIGPGRALTVTFLVPIFGMLWSALFLGERITAAMVAGSLLVLAGTFGVGRAK